MFHALRERIFRFKRCGVWNFSGKEVVLEIELDYQLDGDVWSVFLSCCLEGGYGATVYLRTTMLHCVYDVGCRQSVE